MLRLCAAIEAHNKIVAGVMFHLMQAKRFGKEESAPVCEAANDTLAGEND